MRPDVYTTSHKGLRRALTNLQYMAGRLDYSDDDQVSDLYDEMKSLWDLLDFHAEGEEELIHPHLQNHNTSVYDSLEQEHDELVKTEKEVFDDMKKIKQMSAEERMPIASDFLRNLNGYIARYLLHTQREELEGMPVLWEALDDSQIMQIIGDFPKKATPEVMTYFLRYMLPAVNPAERHGMLKGMKAGLPKPAFENVMKIAQAELSEREYEDLEIAVN